MQKLVFPVIPTVGGALIVTADVVAVQPVTVFVNVNVGLPAATPVTRPALVTVANDGLLLNHVPPVVGDKLVVPPIHIAAFPVILTTGGPLTVTAEVVAEQPVAVFVNVNVGLPAATPVTKPALVTVA